MEYYDKTKEELIEELLEIKQENLELRKVIEKEGFTGSVSGNGFPIADKDLEETKGFFELIFNTSPDAAVISRISDGLIIDVNKGLTALTGFTYEETVGKSIYDINLWKDISGRDKMIKELNEKGFCNNFESIFCCKDGREIVGLVSAKAFMVNGTGHMMSLTRDITQRKNAEDALAQTSAELKAIYELSPVMMCVVDSHRRILFANSAFTSLTGTSEEKLKGGQACGVFGCINAFDDVRGCGFGKNCSNCCLRLALEDTLANGTTHVNVEYETFLAQNGELRKVSLLGSTALIKSNNQRKLLLCLHDITDRKRTELSLRESEQKYRELVDNAFEGIVIINLECSILFANNSILKTFEYENLADIIGKNIFDFIAPEYVAQTIDDFAKVVQGNGVEVAQSCGVTSKGNRVWMESIGKIIDYEGIKADLISIHDITERKKAEESLEISNSKFRNLVTNMQVGVLLQGPNSEITLSNPKALELLGLTEDQLMGKTSFDPNWNVIHEDGSPFPANIHPVPQAIATRLPVHNVIMGVYHPFVRDYVWLMVDAVPQLNTDGTINHVICSFIDISKRRRAEELLLKSQANLNAAQHIAHVGSWEWDIASNTISYSDEFYRIFGIDPDNFDNDANSLLQFIHPQDKLLYIKRLRNGVLKGDNRPFGYRIIRHDGEIRHLFASGHFILNSQKKPVKGIGTIQDITLQKKAENELRKSNAYLENLINYANAPIIVWDPLFQISRFNHAFEHLTGLAEKEVLGKTLEILFPGHLKEKSMNLIRKTLSGERWETVEIQIQHTDRSVKTVLWNSATIFDADGKTPVATIAQGQDITERKQVEEALRKSEFKFREMADLLPQIVFETDINGNLTFVNNQAYKIMGYPEDYPIVGLSTLNFYSQESRIKAIENIRKKVSGEMETESNEYTMVRKDGSTFPALVYSNLELNENRTVGLRGIIVDITEQKKSEALLLKAKQEAESASKAKSMFLANMSHEIRTPLNSIIGFSQLMNRDKSLTPSQKEYNNSIIRAGEHLVTLINDILELSKIEAGHAVLNPVLIGLPDFLRDIHLIFKERARSKHLQFTFETSESLPQNIQVDESKLRQILINLIGNAVKFTDKGIISIRARAEKSNMDNQLLIIEIQDSGPGIPDHELGNLFKHFVQTSSGIKKGSGTGLGLALSRELAQIMGGNITVESVVGKGSTFTFQLAIKEVGNSIVERSNVRRVLRLKEDQKSYRILIVDDIIENLQVVVNLLKLVGFDTKTAEDGKDAIDQYIEWAPDLILMDLRMPVMDGYEASRRIKSMDKGRHTPIIALTASSVDSDQRKMESAGIQAIIRKPFKENELLETIGNILGIQYIFEDEIPSQNESYQFDDAVIASDIAKIPENLINKMQDVLAVADFQRLKNLIGQVGKENPQLGLHLMALAKSFDYAHLQKILISKEAEQ